MTTGDRRPRRRFRRSNSPLDIIRDAAAVSLLAPALSAQHASLDTVIAVVLTVSALVRCERSLQRNYRIANEYGYFRGQILGVIGAVHLSKQRIGCLRMSLAEVHSRTNAVRKLYRNFFAQNTREARGRRLLRDWLSPHRRAQFDDKNYFEVVGCDSQKRYRIYNHMTYGETPNVYEIDDAGQSKVAWCFLPAGRLVAGDIMLAQKIALETDEHNALAIANKFAPRPDLISITQHSARTLWIM